MVYWMFENEARNHLFSDLSVAILHCDALNNTKGVSYVTMVSKIDGNVTKMGVSGVENGKLPNGETYTWKKRR